MIKIKVNVFLTLCCLLFCMQSIPVFGSEVLTVDTSVTSEEKPISTPIPKKTVYPISISYDSVNSYNGIRKTYALEPSEDPTVIPTDSFEQYGEKYVITDIIKKDVTEDQTVEHVELVTINTPTKELNDILPQLELEKKYEKDGYIGTLKLDINTIKCEVAGKKTSSFTVAKTRQYPNLSGADNSLVPKSINEGGGTYNLANVSWKANSNESIDGTPVSGSYTAYAKYTGTGSNTKITGYTTTSEYKGKISKTVQGKTMYTAIFIGEPLIQQTAVTTTPTETPTETPKTTNTPFSGFRGQVSSGLFHVLSVILVLGVIGALGFLLYKKHTNYNITVYNRSGREFRKIGKLKINCLVDKPNIVLDSFINKSESDVYIIEIAPKFVASLIGKTAVVTLDDHESEHKIPEGVIGVAYQFEVDFSDYDYESLTKDNKSLEKNEEEM